MTDLEFSTKGLLVLLLWLPFSLAYKIVTNRSCRVSNKLRPDSAGGWTELQLMYKIFPWAIFWTAVCAPFLDDLAALRAFDFTGEAVALLLLSSCGYTSKQPALPSST